MHFNYIIIYELRINEKKLKCRSSANHENESQINKTKEDLLHRVVNMHVIDFHRSCKLVQMVNVSIVQLTTYGCV